jgi:hypothetical protein
MESGRPACAIPMAAEGEEEPRDGYPSAFGRIAEVLFKIRRDGTEPALIDSSSAVMNPNSLIEAYRPGWSGPNFSGFIYASNGLAGNRVWAFAMWFRGGWTHGSYCRRLNARSIAAGHALRPLRAGPGGYAADR